MAEVAPAPAADPAPAKAPKKRAPRVKKSGSSVGELIVKVVSASKERSGVSLAALKKALVAGGYNVEKNNARVKLALKALVIKGTLKQTTGVGAAGSFKINKTAETKPKKAAPKVKKPVVTQPVAAKKAAAKKSVTAKKPSAAKSPKKVKKTVAAKKATKSPKKATKSPKKVSKSPKKVVKKPTVKKSPAKKVAKPKALKTKKSAPKKK